MAFSLHSCYLRWPLLVRCFSTAYWLLVGSFLPVVALLTSCYLQWLVLMQLLSPMASLIRFVWVSLSFRLRWLDTRVLVICDGFKLTQLLPALGYAHTVATSGCGCYPQWPYGLCGCYLHSDCYLYWVLATLPSSFLLAFFVM